MSDIILLRQTQSIQALANMAINAVLEGEVDPITAHINVSKIEAAIKAYKEHPDVRDITLRELAKYGKKQSFGDCTLEECEAGVKYDYSECNDSELEALEKQRHELDIKIKQRQATLKSLPFGGLCNPNTGEMIYPPAKSSKTTIKTTFKKD